MDSLTHIIVGAALGQALFGSPLPEANRTAKLKNLGWHASLVGAAVSTLPDLDVFIPHATDLAKMTYHRSWSHSFLVQAVAAPVLIWASSKLFRFIDARDWRWHILFLLALFLHTLLDSFTIYGTQAFWPLDVPPVDIGSLFIIDPFFTLPILVGVISAFIMRDKEYGQKLNRAGLFIGAAYLAWTLFAQSKVEAQAREALLAQNIDAPLVKATPAPFNTALWRVIAVGNQNYYIGYRSLIADNNPVRFSKFATRPELLQPIAGHWPVQRLLWNTKGLYSITRENDDLFITDLRMGMENAYMFRFLVGRYENGQLQPMPDKRLSQPRDYGRLSAIWQRIWNETITLE